MTRATTKGGRTFGPMTIIAFVLGVGIGLGLVWPVLPETFGLALVSVLRSDATVIVTGVAALAVLMIFLVVMYQGYLKA